jgi:hypothetical protein
VNAIAFAAGQHADFLLLIRTREVESPHVCTRVYLAVAKSVQVAPRF